VPGFPDGRRKALANDFFFLATPEARHQENAATQAGLAQGDSLVGRGNAKPLRSLGLDGESAALSAVAVGIGFDDRANLNVVAHQVPDSPKVAAQRG